MFECLQLFLFDDRHDSSYGELAVTCVVVLRVVHRLPDITRCALEVALLIQSLRHERQGNRLFG